MKNKKIINNIICALIVMSCLGACSPGQQEESTSSQSSASEQQEESTSTQSSASEQQEELISTQSSASEQQEESTSSQSSTSGSQFEVITDPNGNEVLFAPNETGADNIFITPNPNKDTSGPPPKADGGSPNIVEETLNQKYEAGKLTLIRTQQDGTEKLVDVDAEEHKQRIIGYVDNMESSQYTAKNTPPGSGYTVIEVNVHRNNTIERYIFTNLTVDGNYLGKNLSEDAFNWTIIESDAIEYLLSYF